LKHSRQPNFTDITNFLATRILLPSIFMSPTEKKFYYLAGQGVKHSIGRRCARSWRALWGFRVNSTCSTVLEVMAAFQQCCDHGFATTLNTCNNACLSQTGNW